MKQPEEIDDEESRREKENRPVRSFFLSFPTFLKVEEFQIRGFSRLTRFGFKSGLESICFLFLINKKKELYILLIFYNL